MTLYNFRQNLIKWSIVCSLCAAPSFMLAYRGFSVPAMLLGVGIFIAIYTFANSSAHYHRVTHHRRALKTALQSAFLLKVCQGSFAVIASFTTKHTGDPLLVPDMMAGLLASAFTEMLIGKQTKGHFLATLITTIAEGILISAALLFLALLLWPIIYAVQQRKAA